MIVTRSPIVALAQKDVRVVFRDSFLVFLPVYAFVLALVMRVGVPYVPVENLDSYLAPAVVLFGAILLGTVLGFGLIEEREQGTWLLLRVFPISNNLLFLYFTLLSTLVAALVSLAVVPVYGHPIARPIAFGFMVVASSLTAPVITWVLGAIASNKIEGLAVNKIVSGVLMLPALVLSGARRLAQNRRYRGARTYLAIRRRH